MYKSQFTSADIVSTAQVMENGSPIAEIHLIDSKQNPDHGQIKGLLVCKRAGSEHYPDFTYSSERDQDGRLVLFFDQGEFIANV